MQFPNPGDLFEEKYRIESVLGSGGFARVYKATEEGLDRHVALKILRPPISDHKDNDSRESYLNTLMSRFEREAKLLSKLKSPYTVTMLHYGKTPSGLLYMVLEYIDGMSLAEVSQQRQPLDQDRVARILKQILISLHEAHSLGMLHRDMKPANIMIYEHLGEADHVKLLDFGIAKTISDVGDSQKRDLTSDGTLIGTPRYMAPEQIQGGDIGPPADLYALGLVAYELLAGERAIKDDSSIQIIGKQLAPQSFTLPKSASVSSEFRRLIDRMIVKSLAQRYATAQEIIDDLEAIENGKTIESASAAIEPVEPSSDDILVDSRDIRTDTLDTSKPVWLQSFLGPRNRQTMLAFTGIVILLFIISGLLLVRANQDQNGDKRASQDSTADTQDANAPMASLNEPQSQHDANEEPPSEAADKLDTDKNTSVESPTLVIVSSNVEGVEIRLGDELLGTTPVTVPNDRLPARMRARFNEVEQVREVQPEVGEVTFEFDPAPEKKTGKTRPSPPRNPPKTSPKKPPSREKTPDASESPDPVYLPVD